MNLFNYQLLSVVFCFLFLSYCYISWFMFDFLTMHLKSITQFFYVFRLLCRMLFTVLIPNRKLHQFIFILLLNRNIQIIFAWQNKKINRPTLYITLFPGLNTFKYCFRYFRQVFGYWQMYQWPDNNPTGGSCVMTVRLLRRPLKFLQSLH